MNHLNCFLYFEHTLLLFSIQKIPCFFLIFKITDVLKMIECWTEKTQETIPQILLQYKKL